MPIEEVTFEINNKIIYAILIILVAVSIAFGIYYFQEYQKIKKFADNPALFAKNEASMLKEKVGKLVTLPSDEEPTIVTVTDINKVKNQAFFARAKNGDKVLAFVKARKAILYDPDANQILEMGPLVMASEAAAITTPSPSIEEPTQPMISIEPAISIKPTK
jgi:hypothetical protein